MDSKEKIWFYEVEDDYIEYLRSFDRTVPDPKILDRNHTRKYIGVLFEINGLKYIAPLSSYKTDKHDTMKDTLDFIKVGEYAVININNMIPVLDEHIHKVIFDDVDDEFYRDLLISEYQIIKTKKSKILKNAGILYDKVTKYKNNAKLIERCCNFKLLEEKSLLYATTESLIAATE